jgi:hypothetical protein
MRLAEVGGRIFDRVLDACAWIGCAMLAFQVVSVSVEIICRYFFNISFSIITPLNEWSLVYLTFLGAAWLQREGGAHQRRLDRRVLATVGELAGASARLGSGDRNLRPFDLVRHTRHVGQLLEDGLRLF